MESESEIFLEFQSGDPQLADLRTCLIREGKLFSCYRIERDGKYFFFKTFTEDTPLARRLLRREFDMGASCDNPHIPHLFLFGEYVKGKEGILMEYIDGRPLTEFLAEKPTHAERKKIFLQILDAVAYLHSKGIIHNDLKPDNILIKRTGNSVALIDFGLSDTDAHFLLKSPGYTAGYAAPELVKTRVSDVRSDIYSIGKLMALLFGKNYRRFRCKCIRENPGRRYASVTELRKAWEGRHRLFWAIGGILTLIVLAIPVFLYLGEKEERDRQLHELGVELENQKSLNSIQSEKFSRLQTAYEEVSDSYRYINASYHDIKASYHDIKDSYQGMKDSIAESNRVVLAHETAKKKAIDGFKSGLNKRMYATFDSLKLCSTWPEMNKHRQHYDADVHKYFSFYPKTADGEDLTAVLSALLQTNLEEARLLFNTELSRIRK